MPLYRSRHDGAQTRDTFRLAPTSQRRTAATYGKVLRSTIPGLSWNLRRLVMRTAFWKFREDVLQTF